MRPIWHACGLTTAFMIGVAAVCPQPPVITPSDYTIRAIDRSQCQSGSEVSAVFLVDQSASVSDAAFVSATRVVTAAATQLFSIGRTDTSVSVATFDGTLHWELNSSRSRSDFVAWQSGAAAAAPTRTPNASTAISSVLNTMLPTVEAATTTANIKVLHIITSGSWTEPCANQTVGLSNCAERQIQRYIAAGWVVLISAATDWTTINSYLLARHLQRLTWPTDVGCFGSSGEWISSASLSIFTAFTPDPLQVTLSLSPSFEGQGFEDGVVGMTSAIVSRLATNNYLPCITTTSSTTTGTTTTTTASSTTASSITATSTATTTSSTFTTTTTSDADNANVVRPRTNPTGRQCVAAIARPGQHWEDDDEVADPDLCRKPALHPPRDCTTQRQPDTDDPREV
eukprot:m.146726 g.146726  ORF g.146726 m.146726 type:complete len:399 (+) comp23126_c0_seq3:52-1248(+)